jgi:hypothetical protein
MTDKSPRPLQPPVRTRDLSPPQRSLVEIMREHQFGRIENITVRNGEPIFDCNVKVVRLVRLSGRSRQKDTPGADEFELKQSVRDLFSELARQDGSVIRIEFRHGMPFLLEMTIDVRPA